MNKKNFLLLSIFILGFVLRICLVKQIPPGLNRDEAAIGYTAYSLLTTGKDEYGTPWPISFKSFGDWKLPGYIYITMPFVKIFGLTEIAVRMPAVLFGSLTIFVTYFLSTELLKNLEDDKFKKRWIRKIPILSAFLFAVSPWSIHLSRTASEATFAVFFTSLGLLLYLWSYRNVWNLFLGTVFLVLSLYVYSANHIFTPLLFLGLTLFFWKKYRSIFTYWLSIVFFVILGAAIYSQTLFVADKTKISGLFALGDPSLVYENVTLERIQHGSSPNFIAYLFHNKLLFTVEYTLQHYIQSYSPEFLFITGGGNTQHNIPDFGNLYLWEAPFLLIGLAYLLTLKSKYKYLLIFWFLIAPIAASITKDAPHTARMAAVMPLLEILIAHGFVKGMSSIANNKKIITISALSILIGLFILNFAIWNNRYFIYFPIKRAAVWGEGYTKLISYLRDNGNFKATEVVMSRPEYSPYIYFLFYKQVDPSRFQKEVLRYPETSEGFQHVAKFDNYEFRRIDWPYDLLIPDRIYIDWSDQIPKDATNSSILITNTQIAELKKNGKDLSDIKIGDQVTSRKVGDIKLQNGETMFTLIKTSKTSQQN